MPLRRKFDSLTPAIEKWRRFPARFQQKAVKLVLAIGAVIAKESQRRAPILKGNVVASHRVMLTRRETNAVSVTVEAGDDSTPYIDWLHEDPKYKLGPLSQAKQNADRSVTVGRKFLDRAVNELEDDIVKRIGDELFGELE